MANPEQGEILKQATEPWNLEQTKLEIGVRLEEYRAIRAEIVNTLNAAYQTTTLTLTGISILISASATILKWQKPGFFIVAAFVFYAFSWTQLRYLKAVFDHSEYIHQVVAPGIRSALQRASSPVITDCRFDSILTTEAGGRKAIHANHILLYPLEIARQGVPLLAALISAATYFMVVYQNGSYDIVSDTALLILNAILFTYSVMAALKLRAILRSAKS